MCWDSVWKQQQKQQKEEEDALLIQRRCVRVAPSSRAINPKSRFDVLAFSFSLVPLSVFFKSRSSALPASRARQVRRSGLLRPSVLLGLRVRTAVHGDAARRWWSPLSAACYAHLSHCWGRQRQPLSTKSPCSLSLFLSLSLVFPFSLSLSLSCSLSPPGFSITPLLCQVPSLPLSRFPPFLSLSLFPPPPPLTLSLSLSFNSVQWNSCHLRAASRTCLQDNVFHERAMPLQNMFVPNHYVWQSPNWVFFEGKSNQPEQRPLCFPSSVFSHQIMTIKTILDVNAGTSLPHPSPSIPVCVFLIHIFTFVVFYLCLASGYVITPPNNLLQKDTKHEIVLLLKDASTHHRMIIKFKLAGVLHVQVFIPFY